MKLTFRTIAGKSFQLDAEESLSIADLKAQLEASQGPECPKDLMKLVYKGKVLEDGTTVGSNQITEAGFIVIFINKKPEAPKPAPVSWPGLSRGACRHNHDRGVAHGSRAAALPSEWQLLHYHYSFVLGLFCKAG